MAQIWASYDEVAQLCACDAALAKCQSEARGWPSRRCSDGVVRVKLPADLAYDFMLGATSHRSLDNVAAACADILRRATASAGDAATKRAA